MCIKGIFNTHQFHSRMG